MTTLSGATPGLSDDEMNLVSFLMKQLSNRAWMNLQRQRYYDHDWTIKQMGLDKRQDGQHIRHTLGWIPKAVDALAELVVNEGLVIPGRELSDFGLDLYWTDNNLGIEAHQIEISTLIQSCAFLVTTPGDTSIGEPEVLTTPKDALSGTGIWNTRTRRLDAFLSVNGLDVGGTPNDLVLYLPGETITIDIDNGDWQVDRFSTGLPFVPVELLTFKQRPGRPFGASRITATAMAIQSAAVRTLVRSELSAQAFIDPVRALLNADLSQFQNEDGTPNAAYFALQNSRTLALPPNIQTLIKEEGEIETVLPQSFQMLNGMDMTPHTEHLDMWASQFSTETGLPTTELGVRSSSHPVSAEALLAQRNSLILSAERTGEAFAKAYTRSAQTAWMIANQTTELPAELKRMTTRFRDPNLPSRAAMADAVFKEVASGVLPADSDVAMERLGYSPTDIARVRRDRERAKATAFINALTPAPSPTATPPAA